MVDLLERQGLRVRCGASSEPMDVDALEVIDAEETRIQLRADHPTIKRSR